MDVRRRIGIQKHRILDARQKLNTKTTLKDARFRLVNKRKFSNQLADARAKLVKKGLSDARYLLKKKSPGNGANIKIKVDNKSGKGKPAEMKNFQIIAKNDKNKKILPGPSGFPKFRIENEKFKTNITISRGVARKRPFTKKITEADEEEEEEYEDDDNFGKIRMKGVIAEDEDEIDNIIPMKNRLIAKKPKTIQRKMESTSYEEYVSPIQGFRIAVSNLHRKVTHDDIVELFGNIGTLKRARLIKEGIAEAVFVNKSDAIEAVNRYHMRELDAQPMHVTLTTVGKPFPKQKLSFTYKRSSNEILNVDPKIAHQVLFGCTSRNDPANRPVSFTVKLDVDED
ncbi:DgyrCDS10248 [Dimorphilus gyrociliatus]|uniref:DgyrCDS10248 n=1 Tax=Dimorphilus gyrociliatus TaxID=2664684 RepID=A0A7I8VZV0_9ANNE|nr:DgyrCDS10248 [Dimorphilus gyrociliatus]